MQIRSEKPQVEPHGFLRRRVKEGRWLGTPEQSHSTKSRTVRRENQEGRDCLHCLARGYGIDDDAQRSGGANVSYTYDMASRLTSMRNHRPFSVIEELICQVPRWRIE